MAGDWIKMRGNLWDDPRIARLCDLTDQGEAAVIGGLYWLWATADQHSEDGVMPGLTLRQIDRKTGVQGFAEALVSIGWLADHPEGVRLVRFEEHNGTSAKRRCVDAQRKAGVRAVSASDADKLRTASGQETPNLGAREEKRREEKKEGEAPAELATPPVLQKSKTRKKSEAITLTEYLTNCKASSVKPIPENHYVRRWADDAGITAEMLQIAWVKFRERYTKAEKGVGKRYKDWPAHFATAVESNWFKLWFAADDGIRWTSNGLTCKAVLDARMKEDASA